LYRLFEFHALYVFPAVAARGERRAAAGAGGNLGRGMQVSVEEKSWPDTSATGRKVKNSTGGAAQQRSGSPRRNSATTIQAQEASGLVKVAEHNCRSRFSLSQAEGGAGCAERSCACVVLDTHTPAGSSAFQISFWHRREHAVGQYTRHCIPSRHLVRLQYGYNMALRRAQVSVWLQSLVGLLRPSSHPVAIVEATKTSHAYAFRGFLRCESLFGHLAQLCIASGYWELPLGLLAIKCVRGEENTDIYTRFLVEKCETLLRALFRMICV